MNGKNHERRSLEDIVVVTRELSPISFPFLPQMPKWREMEMPGARAPLPIYPSRLGKGWANAAVCQCLLSSIEHRD